MKKVMVLIAVIVLAGAFTVQAAQKELDPAPTGPGSVPEATGGPDAFGYTWADQASGCTHDWIDISTTGTNLGTGDDATFAFTLGIGAVDFYGTTYTNLFAGTNGWIAVDNTAGTDLSNDCPMPSANGNFGVIAAVHDDLVVDSADGVFHQTFAVCPRPNSQGLPVTGCDIVQWNARHFGGAALTEYFQVIIYETREIVVQVEACGECGSGSTTGIEDETETIGLTYACDTAASIGTGTAVCFFHPNPLPVKLMSFDIE